mmetsp:Transcript_17851/g.67771  ORF Transcript_17851/g.67771 Transcript_17851/m.67771 type:complete len:126 (-) Transcript_17851:1230-1607(-)
MPSLRGKHEANDAGLRQSKYHAGCYDACPNLFRQRILALSGRASATPALPERPSWETKPLHSQSKRWNSKHRSSVSRFRRGAVFFALQSAAASAIFSSNAFGSIPIDVQSRSMMNADAEQRFTKQ